jgi:hypothetical protein
LPKCRIVLTESEVRALLHSRPDIYRAGLQRGKAIIRGRKAKERAK